MTMLGLSGHYESALVCGSLKHSQCRLLIAVAQFVHDLVGEHIRDGSPNKDRTLAFQA